MDSLAWSFVLNSGGLYVAMIYAVLVLSQHFWQTNQGLQTQGWGGGSLLFLLFLLGGFPKIAQMAQNVTAKQSCKMSQI